MIFYSAEVRWFLSGTLPAGTLDWFCAGLSLTAEERTDRYLALPGCDTVGVKIRQGGLEVKALCGAREVIHFPGGVSGRAERWVKWSNRHPALDAWLGGLLGESEGWIDVAKARWLRTFSREGDVIREIPPSLRVVDGCQVEVTRLAAAGGDGWSLGLEAFGDRGRVLDTLRLAGTHFFTLYPAGDPLQLANSDSYPAWLSGLQIPPD